MIWLAGLENDTVRVYRSTHKGGEGIFDEKTYKEKILPYLGHWNLSPPFAVKTYFSRNPPNLLKNITRGIGNPTREPIRESFSLYIDNDMTFFKIDEKMKIIR